MIPFEYDDGGRAVAGFKGSAGDCGTRAIAIATGLDYRTVYGLINRYASLERPRKRRRSGARTGVHHSTVRWIMADLGWDWHPTMGIGTGCQMHLTAGELPASHRLILSLSKHYCTVVDGVVRDTHLDDRGGTRCVYGYWTPGPRAIIPGVSRDQGPDL